MQLLWHTGKTLYQPSSPGGPICSSAALPPQMVRLGWCQGYFYPSTLIHSGELKSSRANHRKFQVMVQRRCAQVSAILLPLDERQYMPLYCKVPILTTPMDNKHKY